MRIKILKIFSATFILLMALFILSTAFWRLTQSFRAKKAEAYLKSGNPVNYLKASILIPFSPLPHLKLGQAYSKQNLPQEAEKEFKEAVWLSRVCSFRNKRLLRSGEYDEYKEAVLLLKKLEIEEAAHQGDLNRLENALASALELNQQNDEVNFWLAVLYSALGRYQEANSILNHPNGPSFNSLEEEDKSGDPIKRSQTLKETLSKISVVPSPLPSTPYYPALIGWAFLKMDYPKLAISQFEKALTIASDYRDAWLWLAKAHLQLNEPAKAQGCLEKAIKIDPVHPETFYLLSLAYQKNQQTQKAQETMSKARMLGGENKKKR